VPVANAVLLILRRVCTFNTENDDHQFFLTWLKKKRISVIGRGETAGAPIAGMLKKLHCTTSILHTETPDPSAVTRMSDIIVSCVGKPKTVTRDMISNRPILVSVGLAKDESGRLVGDYDEQEIRDQCSYYTPTPGGVGPVNVACLMNNLVSAASII
jgi:methylenetetrahydrofolate dehydrogenase (NADP+)/methenyltetrahydrofolate cyclohydrolase